MNSTYGDCSKPKKSKTSEEFAFASYWAHLPSLILCDIFDLLSKEDRRNASAVCKNWRQNSFHPKWFHSVTFRIEQRNLERARFQIYTFGSIASEIKIILNSLSYECVEEFMHLLEEMQKNNNLKSFIIEPTHCRLEVPVKQNRYIDEYKEILKLLKNCLSKLRKFSIGCLENFSLQLQELLESLNPSLVTHLGLASVKDIPLKQEGGCFDSKLITRFTKLVILSVDYDQISDDFLSKLDGATELERLVVHIHAVRRNHPNTTNKAWIDFSDKHPNCELRLAFIHAFRDIRNIHETVMRSAMPLSHLKVFFCEQINMQLIEGLTQYSDTLRSVILVDSLSDNHSSWSLIKPWYDDSPDPFVLTAWLCKRLEELVLFGYKYSHENLIAIGRLRGHTLKRLDIAEVDVCIDDKKTREPLNLNIPHSRIKPWRPLKRSELHPVVRSATAGDSDEYLLPLVLADLN
ncbi:F-box only protein 33 [Diorhabda carinulata]|uniref:F-box only protein 33 n=1 Tax=Diorhabda carinulata TaxID=1163345 RepID=UPI0025A1D0C1|nr:F-box only protein 33 [Diorhabda carinulata]